jgi:hypothetical protein
MNLKDHCDCDYTVFDVIDMINDLRDWEQLDHISYMRFLKEWRNLANKSSRYRARKVIGRNYIFTKAVAQNIAAALWEMNFSARKAA